MPEDKTPRLGRDEDAATSDDLPRYLGQVGDYVLLRQLGRGGMGEVFLAASRDNPDTLRALKVMKPDEQTTLDEMVDRWRRECKLSERLRALKHPNIVQVYEGKVDRARDIFYLAMEYVEGDTLLQLTSAPGLSIDEGLRIGADVAKGIAAAHAIGILHRDVKPSNIMVDNRVEGQIRAYVLDFGIGKELLAEDEFEWKYGDTALGTLAYMPPEELLKVAHVHRQLLPSWWDRDEPVTEKGDVWGLGKVLYEMLSRITYRHRERTEPSGYGKVNQMVMRALSWTARVLPDVPGEVNQLVSEMTRLNPAERPRMQEVDVRLANALYLQDAGSGTQPIKIRPQEVHLEQLIDEIRSDQLSAEDFRRRQGLFMVLPEAGYMYAIHPDLDSTPKLSRSMTYFRIFAADDKREWTFGRGADVDCRYSGGSMSRRHFKVRLLQVDGESRFVIEDIGSTYGTAVNGVQLKAHKPHLVTLDEESPGVSIRAGDRDLVLTMPELMRYVARPRADTIEFKTGDQTPKQKNYDVGQQGA